MTATVPASLFRPGRRSKYNARPTEYNGRMYHSALEARYSKHLDLLLALGEITDIQRQVRFPIVVNGEKICEIVPDFLVRFADGHIECHDTKGATLTRDFALKKKLFRAVYPAIPLEIIRKEDFGR